MIQLSLSLAVLGREKTEKLVNAYRSMLNSGFNHEQVSDRILDYLQNNFSEQIEYFCNRNMILSELKVAEDIVFELKQIKM